MAVTRLTRISLTCADPERLAGFYTAAFGFWHAGESRLDKDTAERLYGAPTGAVRAIRLRLGRQEIELVGFAMGGAPYPEEVPGWSPLFQHFAIIVADMDAAYARLSAQPGWAPISRGGPQRLPERSGGVTAFKLRDPEGHPLEVLAFPEGAAPKPWRHAEPGALFLGIDHSAISVAETARSIRFYEGLGLSVAARSHNHGPEQARLDGLLSADVDVVGMSLPGEAAPHVELLGYRGAFDRNAPLPAGNDVACTCLVFETDAPHLERVLASAAKRSRDAASHPESARHFGSLRVARDDGDGAGKPVPLPDGGIAAILRDPDGHCLMLTVRG